MKYQKVILITMEGLSSWKSCQSITKNLYQAYLKTFSDAAIDHLIVEPKFDRYLAHKAAMHVKQWDADLVVWLDHCPCAALFLEAYWDLQLVQSGNRCPKFIVHLYGDFVLNCNLWQKIGPTLKFLPVHFFVASERQKKLVDSFFITNESNVSVIPFPVDESKFNTQNFYSNRQSIREHFKIPYADKVLLYSGRISFQKNIETLLKIFNSIEPLFEGNVHLLIAGPWDDIVMPYFGFHGRVGSYYTHLKLILEKIKESKITFLGNCGSENLVKLYHASDLFVSLSTYNDEDYGMSPAEALSCGLPCVLSNWGGYSSFASYSGAVSLTTVQFESFRPTAEASSARSELIKQALLPNLSLEKRIEISNEVFKSISIESVSLKIREQLSNLQFEVIQEFTPKFIELCSRFRNNPQGPFSKNENDCEEVITDFYREIYEVYSV